MILIKLIANDKLANGLPDALGCTSLLLLLVLPNAFSLSSR